MYSKRKFGNNTALLTAIALIVLEFPLLHGQIARPYSSGLMLSMLLMLIWDKVVFPTTKEEEDNFIRNSILLSLVFAANAYNHYFSALLAGIIFASGIVVIPRNKLLKYILFGILAFLLFIPHIGITIHHMSIGGIGEWLGKPDSDFLYMHILHIFNDSLALALLVLNAVLLYLLVNKHSIFPNWKARLFVLMLFLLPFLIGYYYSLNRNSVLQHRVLLFSMPFLLMFVFSFFNDAKTKLQYALIGFIPLILIIHTVFIDKYYEKENFINFKDIAKTCSSTHSIMNSNELLRLQHCNSKDYLQYYLQDTSIKFSIYEITTEIQLLDLKRILDSNRDKQFVEYISTKPQNRIATMMISSLYQQNDKFDANKYGHGYHFYGQTTDWQNIDTINGNIIEYKNYSEYTLDLTNSEYSKGIEFKSNIDQKCFLDMRLKFKVQNENTEAMIVFSSENTVYKDKKVWWSVPLKYFYNQEWSTISFQIPFAANKNDITKVYIWNPKSESLLLTDYEIGIYKNQQE